ncbi:MAG: hypothetical protein PUI85_03220 [Eubacteriales bacterium]|nr:hypothetical protein [Eubacteriales bacterium]MDY3333211.1 hypothetical protein [Gallibacter sp.]
MLNSVIMLILVIFIGYFAAIPKDRKFDLSRAFAFVAVETIIGIFLFAILNVFIFGSEIGQLFSDTLGNLFIVILNIAIINGIIVYWIIRLVVPKLKINDRVIMLSEYIIQWSLIYITIYQVIFDNLIPKESLREIDKLDITTPTDMMIFVLPALISSWIAVILYRLYRKNI